MCLVPLLSLLLNSCMNNGMQADFVITYCIKAVWIAAIFPQQSASRVTTVTTVSVLRRINAPHVFCIERYFEDI